MNISTPPFPALSILQTETFASMARDVALFERQSALTEEILADQRRQERNLFIDAGPASANADSSPLLGAR